MAPPSPSNRIPMSSPDLTDAERQAVMDVLNTPNLSMGSQIQAFEESFCAYTGARHAIGVNSGTAGLHLCVRAAGIGPGDLVITTPFSFVASANVLLFEQAVPVFVDVDSRTGNIDPATSIAMSSCATSPTIASRSAASGATRRSRFSTRSTWPRRVASIRSSDSFSLTGLASRSTAPRSRQCERSSSVLTT